MSLFTSALYYDDKIHPLVLVSDELTHSKETVIAYMDILFEKIPSHVECIDVWSDGPASQFKNQYVMSSLPHLESKHNVTIKWNFFATSHGKGPVDGIGATVKRIVWSNTKNRR